MSTLINTLAENRNNRKIPLEFPWWKHGLVALVLVLGVLYALPNLFPDDPALQVTGATAAISINDDLHQQVETLLRQNRLSFKAIEQQDRSILVRFKGTETQLKAKAALQRGLGDEFLVALNLAPTTPAWLRVLGAHPLNLGLDLRGGVHFLLEVDMEQASADRLESYADELRTQFRQAKIRYRSIKVELPERLLVNLNESINEEKQEEARSVLREQFFNTFAVEEKQRASQLQWILSLTEAKRKEIQEYALAQNLTTLRNRVNELGVAEATVQRQGANRIVVELPGVQDTATAKRVLGRTASLEFRLQDWKNQTTADNIGRPVGTSELYPFKADLREPVLLKRKVIATGNQVIDAQASYDENGRPQVNITLDGKGGKQMHRVTRDHVGEPMAVLFVEHKSRWVEKKQDGVVKLVREPTVEKYVINVATIQSALGARFRITGLDSPQESSELALLLRAGALAAPLYFVEERTIGPSLGQENIDAGFRSIMLGFMLVIGFMFAYYRMFGLIANLALLSNLVILIALMSLIPGATLTLPGMAGIVLTVGMAVDANVLIYARIREELAKGLGPHAAIESGYERAFVTIWDANFTTLIVAVILFAVGNGPVKGFAVTLSFGILTSLFTAIIGTRSLVSLIFSKRNLQTLKI